MSNLNSFAELIRKGKEDKRLKDLQEQKQVIEKNTPLLGDLFKTVASAKKIVEKRAAVLDKVDELEANQVTQEDIEELVTEKLETIESAAEKKLMSVVKKLQEDIANLKRHVDSKPSYSAVTAGSGEVRILRMDDIVKGAKPTEGDTLVWSATLNKFELKPAGTSGGTTVITTDEEVPYAKRIDFISDNLIYKGEALPGSSESAPVWRIHKVTLATDSDVAETWADGVSTYTKVWDQRLTYNYS